MMRELVIAAFAVATLGALPVSAQVPATYIAGSEQMAGDAIANGDYSTALASLEQSSAHDAGRLINLANAYAGLGRYADARQTYLTAIRSQSYDVVTADGAVENTRAVAQRGLRRLEQQVASR